MRSTAWGEKRSSASGSVTYGTSWNIWTCTQLLRWYCCVFAQRPYAHYTSAIGNRRCTSSHKMLSKRHQRAMATRVIAKKNSWTTSRHTYFWFISMGIKFAWANQITNVRRRRMKWRATLSCLDEIECSHCGGTIMLRGWSTKKLSSGAQAQYPAKFAEEVRCIERKLGVRKRTAMYKVKAAVTNAHRSGIIVEAKRRQDKLDRKLVLVPEKRRAKRFRKHKIKQCIAHLDARPSGFYPNSDDEQTDVGS